MDSNQGKGEAIIIVKAAPQVSDKYGETVCCAGITLDKKWVRLYPVTFRTLEDAKKFGRWDHIRFEWVKPKNDNRKESLRINQQSLEIIGELPKRERESFLASLEKTSVKEAAENGESLVLLRPRKVHKFFWEKKNQESIDKEKQTYRFAISQEDLFFTEVLRPYEPSPYLFKYKYETDDGIRVGTCQDWEVEATFYRWRRLYGEEQALNEMKLVYGERYPEKGMILAMGTHSKYPDTWLINGVLRLDEIKQLSLF